MKYFLINTTRVASMEQVEEMTPKHRAYLKTQYDAGIMLFSGPRVPRTGGVLFARGEDISVIENMIAADPFKTTDTMSYEVVEMAPTQWSAELTQLFGG
jgi:uncharacterized protein YciI